MKKLSKGTNFAIPENMFSKFLNKSKAEEESKDKEETSQLSDSTESEREELQQSPTKALFQTPVAAKRKAAEASKRIVFSHGPEELKTPHMKKVIHDKNKQIHAVLDAFHGKVQKKVASDRKASLTKACKSLEPLCKEIQEDCKLVEKQQKQIGELMKLMKEHNSMVETMKQRQLKYVTAVQKLVLDAKQELESPDASAVKEYPGMAAQLQDDMDKAINQMTAENAKFFIEKFCNSIEM
ncbi:Hypothetical predicted protein [Cloeon dipterum]|uniref:Uncharacterized protein n=1 Tax=Cloeon dipterum TaxID=197152 RepID=A0A8S1CWV1_9INSE|nr:Hypothetical predicted protein [Cloeon dipterum]